MLRSVKTLAINAAVVSALVGGGVAYITFDNAVALSVDGKTQTVHTFGDTVEDVLADQGIEVGDHDDVVPSAESPVQDGSEISVRYGREITVIVDGVEQTLWTTALSVDEALAELGIRASGAEVSVARSLGIGRSGLEFEVRTPKEISLIADGETVAFNTTALTVREVLTDAGITLGDRDLVSPTLESVLADAATVTVQRVTVETETVTAAVAHETTQKKDDSLAKGTKKVETEGKDGSVERVVENVYIDGKLHHQDVLSETVLAAPVTEIVLVGTKVAASDEGDLPSDVATWDRLAQCESGGNWSINSGNGYYGGLQFSVGTWQAYGGSGYPHENSKAEQIRIATKVRDARGGYGDWPACARSLGLPLG